MKVIAEELSFLAGAKTISVSGTAKIEKTAIEGKNVERIYTRGKNLLFQFPEYTIRVHFVMFGSYTITVQGRIQHPVFHSKRRPQSSNSTDAQSRCSATKK